MSAHSRRSAVRILAVPAAPPAILVAEAGTTINHTYEPATNFGPLKS